MGRVIALRENPKAGISSGNGGDRRKYTDKRPREYLTEQEIELLIKHVSSRNSERDRALILVGFQHGLRAQEIATLAWSNIDFEQKIITVARIKDSEKTTQTLSHRAVKYLKAWKKIQLDGQGNQHYVFTWGGKHIEANAVWKLLRKLGIMAKLTIPIHPHMLKHSCGRYLAEKTNGNVLEIMAWLGHKSVKNTMVYVKGYKASRGYF